MTTPSERLLVQSRSFRVCAVLVVLASLLCSRAPAELARASSVAFGTNGILATGHPAATQAGLQTLKTGGNAIDAAVAAALMLGVVDGDNSGIGGGCLMLIRLANGRFVAIDGRERAPAAATRDMFVRQGRANPRLSQAGALASGVPGALAVYDYAAQHFGKKPLKELLLPAAALADQGFTLGASYARGLKSVAPDLARHESSRAVFFKGSKPLARGDVLKQTDLATTYRAIAEHGTGWFYHGPFAATVERWMKANGGIMTAADLADYQIAIREPVRTTYRGFDVVSFPPPSSGGVLVAEMLNILERFDLRSLDEATRLHLLAETMKLAFADRAHWLGDPDFAGVPHGLASKDYATTLAKGIRLDRTTKVASHGTPPDWQRHLFQKHTTHLSVADAEGNWVACTATINTSFGSKVVVPGTGVLLNNEMDDFAIQPGVANYFGLVGTDANSIAPGKRPLSSMAPTIVLKDGEPIVALGAAGGPKIITAVLLQLISVLDLGMEPAEAIAVPRIHHQWSPDELMIEKRLPQALRVALQRRGHKIKVLDSHSTSHLVGRRLPGPGFVGVADPRAHGAAMGW